MMTLHHMPSSGNSYKVRLLLAHLGIPVKTIATEYGDGYTERAEYFALNPTGKVPLLELEDGRLLPESNAILCYLADGTPFLPTERFAKAQCLQWLFFEQNFHEASVAVRGAILRYEQRAHMRIPEKLDPLLESGNKALGVVEQGLEDTDFLVGNAFSIADICLYAYTHNADEGGFDLSLFPNIESWLARIAAMEKHQPIDWVPPAS